MLGRVLKDAISVEIDSWPPEQKWILVKEYKIAAIEQN